MKKINTMLGLVLLAGTHSFAAAVEQMWVQPPFSQIRIAPRMDSKVVASLRRGDEVSVLEKKEYWYRVRIRGVEGYVSRVLLTDHKPVGAVELSTEGGVSEEKRTRVRVSNHAATMGVRGLSADERVRDGRELYQSNADAVVDIEKKDPQHEDLDKFKRSAKLNAE